MSKKFILLLSIFCNFSSGSLYAGISVSNLFNWLINGIEIPFKNNYTKDVSLSNAPDCDMASNMFFIISNANGPLGFDKEGAEYFDYNKTKPQRIFPCIRRVCSNVRKAPGTVMVSGKLRDKAICDVRYNFMPLDLLLISCLSYGAYWLYKNEGYKLLLNRK